MYSNSYMPWELVIETLIRVPIKSMLRFRSLSRSCNSLITSNEFIHSHYNWKRSKEEDESHLILLVNSNKRSIVIREISYTLRVENDFGGYRTLIPTRYRWQFKNLKVLASCNGLVCLIDKESCNIVLWNPCVNKGVVLPVSQECVALGFGFDSDTKDYKVFRVLQCGNRRGAEVYSLRNRSWKAVNFSGDFVDPTRICPLRRRLIQCVYNNVVHNLAEYLMVRGRRVCKIMFKFDLRHDSVEMVQITLLSGVVVAIFEYNGFLAVLERSRSSFFRYRVLVLEEYGDMSSWKFVFEMRGNISNALGSRKNGEILMWDYDKGLVSYDPEIRRISNLQRATTGCCIRAFTYVESLFLFDEGCAIEQLSSPANSNKRKERYSGLYFI